MGAAPGAAVAPAAICKNFLRPAIAVLDSRVSNPSTYAG
jgi:hypothetical protein